MGYDLFNGKHNFRANISIFPRFLNLAFLYGWMPKGTIDKRPDSEKWDGGYLSNEGQFITGEDASEIADALEKAINEIPILDLINEDDFLISKISSADGFYLDIDDLLKPFESIEDDYHYDITTNNKSELFKYFGNEIVNKKLHAFINYCREGGFTIH